MDNKTMWVKSANGKGLHLIDTSTPQEEGSKEFFFVHFSPEEAEKGKSKEVPANAFFSLAVANGILAAGDAPVKRTVTRKVKSDEEIL